MRKRAWLDSKPFSVKFLRCQPQMVAGRDDFPDRDSHTITHVFHQQDQHSPKNVNSTRDLMEFGMDRNAPFRENFTMTRTRPGKPDGEIRDKSPKRSTTSQMIVVKTST